MRKRHILFIIAPIAVIATAGLLLFPQIRNGGD